MKQSLLFLFALMVCAIGHSQNKDFDLSKYKFPDHKRHQLEFNFNSTGYNWNTSYKTSGWSTANTRTNLDLSYIYENLTRKQIDYVHSSISGLYKYSMQNNDLQKEKLYEPEASWTLYASRDYYLTENKLFLEGLASFDCSLTESKKTIDNNVDFNNKSTSYNAKLGIGAGYGRKEKVSDLWQAYYILENLKKQNSLDRDIDESDIFEFASFTSKLKNKRFFDFRLRKIAELQELDSLLHNQGLVKESDISYFTTLNDYWNFTEFTDRESGKIIKILVSPEFWTSRNKSINASPIKSSTIYLKSNLLFECNKQLNLFWERIVKLEISNETLLDQSGRILNNYPENYPENLLSTALSISYGFYPNTRTNLHTSIGYFGNEEPTYQGIDFQSKFWKNEIYLEFSGGYYISPQIQVYGNLYLSRQFEAYNNGDHRRLNYNLGLRYAIF